MRSFWKTRGRKQVEAQRLLMPIIVELRPAQQAIFLEIAEELRRNGFEAEPFGIRTIAIQSAPAGISADDVAEMLEELLEQFEREQQALNLEKIRHPDRGFHRLPRRHQGEYAAGYGQDGMVAGGIGKNQVSDELSPRQTDRAAVFCEGHSEGF